MSARGPEGTVPGTGKILSKEEAEAIAKKVLSFADPGADTVVGVQLSNNQNTRFSRNEITTQLDNSFSRVTVTSTIRGRTASGITQRFDDDGLRQAVKWAEESAQEGPGEQEPGRLVKPRSYPTPPGLWSDATRAVDVDDRIGKAVSAIERTDGYVSVGSFDLSVGSRLVANSEGLVAYCRETGGSLSMTARTKDNTGSGWAGGEFYDFGKLDAPGVAARATDKAYRSREPTAVEPGRYTVILEPSAYADMIYLMMRFHMGLESAERGTSVFTNPAGGTKIGLKVMDDRLSFVSDPMDPDGPFCPFSGNGTPFDRTAWIEDGYLRALSYSDARAQEMGKEYALANPLSVRLEPKAGTPLMTLDEMIETCDRGIYVSRLTIGFADFRYLVFTGVTRDGTWLIERGKISRPIQNLRYLDSHLFFLNNLEAVGKPELAVSAAQIVLPPVRCRDFNFTAIADAV